ncbi:signal peptide peptidase-like 3 [Apostichopus japonicus]|uniref:signal peptide peptidase-like 3 n=1 Tax=Stichopus japonicus TaxID=307972 RepID=UPI003AB6ADF4
MNRPDRIETVSLSEYDWAYSLVDSSRVSTFLISILLIVYGSFRSLNMEQEERKDREPSPPFPPGQANPNPSVNDNYHNIDTTQAMFLPIGASVSLLVMFFFFDSMQMVFAVCTAVLATVAFAFLLLPMCQYIMGNCSTGTKISFGICGRFTSAEILSFCLSVMLVFMWVMTGHWLLMDALAMGLCVTMIAFVRLPSLKVSTLLLTGLLIYDVFWVFFSTYIFNANVMVRVATRPADNPVGMLAKRLDLPNVAKDAPKLSLPGKLIFPSMHSAGHFSMLGLGDIVMPGLLLCFVLRYDNWKRQSVDPAAPQPALITHGSLAQKVTYFHCSLIGYFVGLLTATVSSEIYKNAQPALLYLVPFTLLPLVIMAYLKGDLKRMWHEPFIKVQQPNYMEV